MSSTTSNRPLLPIGEALARILERATPLASEDVPLAHALGRFLARPVAAPLDLPPFSNSSMDGYAIRAADTPGPLRVAGESAAGSPFQGTLGAGEAVAISTGAVIPDGADAVAELEIVDVFPVRAEIEIDADIEIGAAVAPGASIRHAGSDIRRGAQALPAGIRIGPAQIGALAALGLTEVPCGARPQVAILATGSELRPPGEALGPGQIYDSNRPMLTALAQTAGATVTTIPSVADTEEAHLDALTQALTHDVVISSGGVSVGPHDLVRGAGRELGIEEIFWRIALRPGKPLSFGVRDRGPAGPRSQQPPTLVFGLPGNPVSALVCFELFVRPALARLQGAIDPAPEFELRTLATTTRRNPHRDDLIRVRITPEGTAEPLAGQQSHQITASALADGLIRIPQGEGEIAAGSELSYLPLHGLV
ncbi:MAG: molybdopterin molybdotransferase MoeA [Conexibacteraceae bacterium]|nr:molybdopterin molybdotransferase MoeA [Conexibacteraceae bacterium]